ncbi:long-chain-fatty-acid--CoA ligase heimdall-like [Anastrepha obliqua]|uniref:long-chain-fatty-acid--CoA ligase heimdall-like n=1 Tax=Anastrepha obliqua TaxID=95512 RepID=UPI002409CA7B|nr:long-chain-fatty-acid--CoA ligase heimdall-like [Anastrepha obliqua]
MKRISEEFATFASLKPATSYTSTSLLEPVRLRIAKQGVSATAPQTIPQLFRECCQRFPNDPALVYENKSYKNNSTASAWTTVTYEEYERNVERAALALLHLGFTPNNCIGFLANNCPDWYFLQFGALRVGGVVAGIYLTSSSEAVKHALETTSAVICVVDDAKQLAKVRAVRDKLPRLQAVIQLYGSLEDGLTQEAGYYRWSDLMALTYERHLLQVLKRSEMEVAANQCALLIFTSGTTGLPKAVMLSHDSITLSIKISFSISGCTGDFRGVTISYLPMNHIAGQIFEIVMPLLNGDCVYFAGPDALKGSLEESLRVARPTRIFSVPRIFEKIQVQLQKAEDSSSLWWRYIIAWAKGTLLNSYMNNTERIKPKTTIKYILASIIMQKFKTQLGLDRCENCWIGSAPLPVKLKKFFLSMDIPVADIFGTTEAGGGISFTQGYCHLDSCGKILPGVEAKIDKPNSDGQGEICVTGRCIMMGYLNEPEKTSEAIDAEGWLHTGDVGVFHSDGCILITGRIKEIIITKGGVNIQPYHVEDLIKAELPCLSNALLVGDNRKYLTALLTLKTNIDGETGLPLDTLHPDTISWLQSLGCNYSCLSAVLRVPAYSQGYDYKRAIPSPDQNVVAAIDKARIRANERALSRAQKVQKFALLPHDFTVPTGELGPTLKFRRSFVINKYLHIIDRLYSEES